MTKEEIEQFVTKEKIMSMAELKMRKEQEGIIMSTEQVVRAIVVEELQRIPKSNEPLGKNEVHRVVANFSPSTAQRQISDLRAGRTVWGPVPTSLEPNTKVYYPIDEVAAVMYLQSHSVAMYGAPSLKRILETRHD